MLPVNVNKIAMVVKSDDRIVSFIILDNKKVKTFLVTLCNITQFKKLQIDG